MRNALRAARCGLCAPFRRVRLVLLLWCSRLVPLLFLAGLPAWVHLRAGTARHPDAALLLDTASRPEGFAAEWQRALFADLVPSPPFGLAVAGVVAWLLVTVLAGGLTVRLLGQREPLAGACLRLAGRFLRLGLVMAVLLLAVHLAIAGPLRASQASLEHAAYTQDAAIRDRTLRGALLLLAAWTLWLLHSCARIDLVVHERRSVLRALAGGAKLMLEAMPALLVVELAMLTATAVAALLFWAGCRVGLAAGADSGPLAIGLLMLAGALLSYLRTGVELGHFEARCRLLGPNRSRIEAGPAVSPGAAEAAEGSGGGVDQERRSNGRH